MRLGGRERTSTQPLQVRPKPTAFRLGKARFIAVFVIGVFATAPLFAQSPPSPAARMIRPAIAAPFGGASVQAARPSWESLKVSSNAAGSSVGDAPSLGEGPSFTRPSSPPPAVKRRSAPSSGLPLPKSSESVSGGENREELPLGESEPETAADAGPGSRSAAYPDPRSVGQAVAAQGATFAGALPKPARGAGGDAAFSDAFETAPAASAARSVFAGSSDGFSGALSGGDDAGWDGEGGIGGGLLERVASGRRYFDAGEGRTWGREAPGRFLSEEASWLEEEEDSADEKAKSTFTTARNPYVQPLSGVTVLEEGVWPNFPVGQGLLRWTDPNLRFWVPQRFDLGGNRTGGTKNSWTVQVKPVWSSDGPLMKHSSQISGRLTEVNGVRSANEWIFTSTTDRRIEGTPWLVFGKILEEFDQMEKISLRSTITAGMGYRIQGDMLNRYVIFRLGPTINYERYYGPFREVWTPEILTEIEMKYVYQRMTLEHKTSFFPSLTQNEYRMVNDSGLLLPLDSKSVWSIRTGFLQNYNDRVAAGLRPWSYEASLTVVFQRTPVVAGSSGTAAWSTFR